MQPYCSQNDLRVTKGIINKLANASTSGRDILVPGQFSLSWNFSPPTTVSRKGDISTTSNLILFSNGINKVMCYPSVHHKSHFFPWILPTSLIELTTTVPSILLAVSDRILLFDIFFLQHLQNSNPFLPWMQRKFSTYKPSSFAFVASFIFVTVEKK